MTVTMTMVMMMMSSFALLTPQVGFYLCNHNAKYWLIYSFDAPQNGRNMKSWSDYVVRLLDECDNSYHVQFESLGHNPHSTGGIPLVIYHLIDATLQIHFWGERNTFSLFVSLSPMLFSSLQLNFWHSLDLNHTSHFPAIPPLPSHHAQYSSLCCTVKHGNVDTLCCWGDLSGFRVLRFGICCHWCTRLGLLR